MFTAHVSGWSKNDLLDTPISELKMWYDEALSLHNFLNSTDEDKDGGQES